MKEAEKDSKIPVSYAIRFLADLLHYFTVCEYIYTIKCIMESNSFGYSEQMN